MGEFSLTHILIFGLILLVIFGPSRLPALGQSLGKAIKGFKQGLNEIDTNAKDVTDHKQLNENQPGMNQNAQSQTQAQPPKQNQNNS